MQNVHLLDLHRSAEAAVYGRASLQCKNAAVPHLLGFSPNPKLCRPTLSMRLRFQHFCASTHRLRIRIAAD